MDDNPLDREKVGLDQEKWQTHAVVEFPQDGDGNGMICAQLQGFPWHRAKLLQHQ